jgi:hypothetical protein
MGPFARPIGGPMGPLASLIGGAFSLLGARLPESGPPAETLGPPAETLDSLILNNTYFVRHRRRGVPKIGTLTPLRVPQGLAGGGAWSA